MPIYINEATTLSAQDQLDLAKVYADYPLADVHKRLQAFIDGQLDASWKLIHARFNDRLIAAMWVKQQHKICQAHDLCVRDITRGRGVATRLLAVSKEILPTLVCASHQHAQPDKAIIEHLMNKFEIAMHDTA